MYLFDGGVVLVNSIGKVKAAWAWQDVNRVGTRLETVRGQLSAVTRQDFTFLSLEPGSSFVINDLEMPAVGDLAQYVKREVQRVRGARLATGQAVRFGVFEVSPLALRHIPISDPDRPSIPVTVPWQKITGIAVAGPQIIVRVAGGADIVDKLLRVPDPDQLMHAVRQRIRH